MAALLTCFEIRQRRTKRTDYSASVRCFKIGLRPAPQAPGDLQHRAAGVRQRDHAAATVDWRASNPYVLQTFKRPQVLAHRRAVKVQALGQVVDRNTPLLSEKRKNCILRRTQPGRRQLAIVE